VRYSVIIPAFNAEATLPALLRSLSRQTYGEDFEIIVVDDCSLDATSEICRGFGCMVVRLPVNRGPACCRNLGSRHSAGDILIFTDSDCTVAPDWIEQFDRFFTQDDAAAVMGKLVLLPSTLVGDSISALGFPAGGALGFEKVWRVSEEGYTNSLSSCNCGIRRVDFEGAGGFDESFPYAGGEDSYLAYRLTQSGCTIRYCPEVVAYHGARESLVGFLIWQFRRGISSYIFSKKVTRKGDFISLRLWSARNVIRTYRSDRKFPLVLSLLATSFLVQTVGFFYAKFKR